jgi:glycosyltransferase involved in cell wall biosynthesis
MRAAIFFDEYMPLHETKDPGLLALGLNRLCCSTSLITLGKPELENYNAPFVLIARDRQRFADASFWRRLEAEVVICYTWLDPSYNDIVAALRDSGKIIVLKADSDGRLGYPLAPRYFQTTKPLQRLKHVCEEGAFFSKIFPSYRSRVKEIIRQIQMANAVLIESPKALSNMREFLGYWWNQNLLSKFHVIPNPVADDVMQAQITAKENVLMSVGRWDSPQKNAAMLLKCSHKFLTDNDGWRLQLVSTLGHGRKLVENIVSRWTLALRSRVEIQGPLESHGQMVQLFNRTKIFFVPSRWEGFPIAAAEAVCMGCTIAGTPLEALDFLVAEGFSGKLSKGFTFGDLTRTLQREASSWLQNVYNPFAIAAYWRQRLSSETVASQVMKLFSHRVGVT